MTPEHCEEIASALLGDFSGGRTLADRKLERLDDERHLLKQQLAVLDMLDRNDHVYFDGPAGTGKSYLIAHLAKRWRTDRRTLVTCWNVLMADELRDMLRTSRDIVVDDLNTLMLRLAGLDENPADASREWYWDELPSLALEALEANPSLGQYDAICVDEVQDIAGFPKVLDLVFALAASGTGARFAFAGDARQQILRPADAHVDPYAVVRERVPDLVHVALRRGLRQVSGLTESAEKLLSRQFGYRGHRVPSTVDGSLAIKQIPDAGGASHALAEALRELLEHHQPHDIVILSPFGERRSLVGQLLAAEHFSKEERWLRERLRVEAPDAGQPASIGRVDAVDGDVEVTVPVPTPSLPRVPHGRVRWGSIFKYKGLDAEAVILTDIGDEALTFVRGKGLDWFDLLYVGLTRARYRCVVVPN